MRGAPAGIPDDAKVTTSREVKSGRRNASFSNSLGHGRSSMNCAARSTSVWNLRDCSRLTTDTNLARPPRSAPEKSCSILRYLALSCISMGQGGRGPFELAAHAERVAVTLDEADVGLDRRALL